MTRSKWFFSLVSFDTRCHSYFNSFNELKLKSSQHYIVGRFSGCKYKTLFNSFKGFLIFYFNFFLNPQKTSLWNLSTTHTTHLNHTLMLLDQGRFLLKLSFKKSSQLLLNVISRINRISFILKSKTKKILFSLWW